MISQGLEDIEITSGFGPLRPLMDARWEGPTAQNDPIRTSAVQVCCDAQRGIPTTLKVLRRPESEFIGSRNCNRVGSFGGDAKISHCRFDLRVSQQQPDCFCIASTVQNVDRFRPS